MPPQTAINNLGHSMLWHLRRMPERTVERGLPPAILGWRWRRREALDAYLHRTAQIDDKVIIREPSKSKHPLPRNVASRANLDTDGALWGYSLRDVPSLPIRESYIAEVRNCRILFFHTPDKKDFFPAIVTPDDTSLECREISYRPGHAKQSAMIGEEQHFKRATWILERAYHNHSHWLTAHLPKLLILRERGELDDVLLPEKGTAVMDASMRMLGMEPGKFRTFDPSRPISVDKLTLVGTDRFDPAHMRAVRDAFSGSPATTESPSTKVFISRAKSRGRRLTNEDELWSLLSGRGFTRVLMEELDFEEQVRLMQQTHVLLAPHGAGLTNMIFCPPGGHVVEMADPGFPNPNFYNLASGLDLNYWLLHEPASDAPHPLDRDLEVDVAAVEKVLDQIG